MSRASRGLKTGLKWLLATLAVILLLVVLVVSAVLLALRSEAGTAWVLEQIPGLETSAASGSLLGEWRADHLAWQGYGVQLEAESPLVRWIPTCLFRQRLCLDRLEAASLDVTIAPGEDEDAPAEGGSIELPEVNLPLNVEIRSVELGPMDLNGTRLWDQLTLEAGGGGSDFHIRRFNLNRDDLAVALDGRIETRGDWPLAIDVDLTLPPPEGERWQVKGQLRGSVRDLRADLTSSGYLDGQLEAELEPLDPALPASLTLQSPSFRALESLPPTLTLENWTLTGQGSLANGFRVSSRARLPGEQGPVHMDLSARVSPQAAQDLQLTLTGPAARGDGRAELSVDGEVAWQGGLTAQADVNMGAFAWYALLPQVEPPPVTIDALQATARFADNRYQARLEMEAAGPMGESTLVTQLDGDMASVRLNELTLTTGAGQLRGEAEVGFAGPLQWQADLTLDAFDPGYWVPQASASINGSVTTSGQLTQAGTPDFNAQWDLQGQWQEAPLTSRGSVEAASGQWQIPEVLATIGNNRVLIAGQLRDPLAQSGQLTLEGEVSLPEPGLLLPGLSGELQASLDLEGPIRLPYGSLELTASDLAWQDQLRVRAVQLSGRLDDAQSVDAELTASALEAGGQTISDLRAELGGSLEDHRLTLSVDHSSALVDATLNGAWETANGGRWQGELTRSEVELTGPDQRWQLASPAPIEFAGQTLTVGAHCWRWQGSSLCAGEQTLLPQASLDLQLSQLPASTLAPLLPENLRWDAMINGTVDVALTRDGPRGTVRVNAGPGEVELVTGEVRQTLDYDTLRANLELEPQVATVALRLDGPDVGTLTVDMTIDPNASDRTMQGSYRLEGFDLAVVGALLQIEDMAGVVAGSGRLEGPLLSPQVYGQLTLSEGRLVDDRIPTPIQDLRLQVNFQGSRAELNGSWQGNGTGTGQIGGTVDWSGRPRFTITLQGETLPLYYEPYANLSVSPDLEVTFADGQLAITGRVAIPNGSVEVRELPEQAVSVSEDEVIVGDEGEPPGEPLNLAMDITVVVGEEEVTFQGFGVTGNLKGELQIGNGMETRGVLRLTDGQYAAFGQELELRRARLVFVGPVSEPYLDIEAVRRVDDVLAGIRLSGPAREPETEVFSEPAMPQNQALSYLILGRPLQSQGDQNQVSRMALSLGLRQASGLTRGIGEAFGIQDLTLEAEGSGEQASVVASGYLTEDLSLRYGVGLFEPVTTVALRYELGRYFYIEAASGLASSLDIFYNRDF